MLHRTGSRRLHTAKKLTVHHRVDQSDSSHDVVNVNTNTKVIDLKKSRQMLNNK